MTTLRKDKKYLAREISWLQFNERVLQEAADPTTPVIERIKFLGIFSNNLDEFYRVRVATVRRMLHIKKLSEEYRGLSPQTALKHISDMIAEQQAKVEIIYQDIIKCLKINNIHIVDETKLNKIQGEFVKDFFREKVRANLFPIMINDSFDYSTLRDKSIYLTVHLSNSTVITKDQLALIELPSVLPRFIILPQVGLKKSIMFLDDVIRFCLEDIFAIFRFDSFNAYTIKLTRDAELDIDNDVSKSFLEIMAESIKQRRQGKPVRFIYDENMPDKVLRILLRKLNLSKVDNIIPGGKYHNFKDLMKFPNVGDKNLEYPVVMPLQHSSINPFTSIFSIIKYKDIILHYPYQTFNYIIDFLREASIDPKVISIKMTLYRVADDSNVIKALINAARNGKKVTVFLEIQARFDEEANIYWSNKLQEEGVKVIHGVKGLKVHCKLILIKRKENNKIVYYSNFSTGNFNEKTATTYCDDSLLTSDTRITREIDKIFDLFESSFKTEIFSHLILSPLQMRKEITNLIGKEIKNAKAGKKAQIILKLNNLVDREMIRKLYVASIAGVEIKLIIRSICTLIPGKKGFSENIEAFSIVDKFLEHSRVFIFFNGGDEKYYITSADFMSRNLDHRIEVACPIFDKSIQKEIRNMIEIQMLDNVKARWFGDNVNQYRKIFKDKKMRSQTEIYHYLKQKSK